MKKLDVKLGGDPFVGDDLLWLQSSLVEGLKSFIDMFGASAAVLYGVEFSIVGSNLNWTAGWVYINGEICQMDAGSAVLASNNTLQIVETYDPTGNEEYEDSNIEDTYVIRKATVSGTAGGTNHYQNLKRLNMNAIGDWQAMNPILSTNWVGLLITATTPGYRKNQISDVVMKGTLEVISYNSGTDSVAFTLPVGYRPKEDVTLLAGCIKNGTKTTIHVDVLMNGNVMPLGLVNSDNLKLHLYSLVVPTT